MRKKTELDEKDWNRRGFLRQSACASLGITGMVNSLAHLKLINSAMGASTNVSGDYKALVVVFLNGGNDSNNMLIPATGHPERGNYDQGRGVMAIPDDEKLHKLNHEPNSNLKYGVHPEAPELAAMFNNIDPEGNGTPDLAFVANVGTLAEPVEDRYAYFNSAVLPLQLYSHNDQQLHWQSSIPDRPFQSGWGGRISEILNPDNASSQVSMNISVNGLNFLQVGNQGAVPYEVSSGGIKKLAGFNDAGSRGNYEPNVSGYRLEGFEKIMDHVHESLMEEQMNKTVRSAKAAEGVLSDAITEANTSTVDFDDEFPDTYLGNELKMIARLIAGRDCLGNNRQTFFTQVGGYDTHAELLASHANLMHELSEAFAAFNKVMKDLGLNENVLLMTHSDFNRTLTPNGSAGSDHAWGGHQIVMGGPVKGGKVYGEFPSLLVGAQEESIDTSGTRGRWIPETSVDQYIARAAKWFGVVDTGDLETILPNLSRFEVIADLDSNSALDYI